MAPLVQPSPPISPVLVVGLGEIGSLLSVGFLRQGVPVVPVLRSTVVENQLEATFAPRLCVLAVGEPSLATLLDGWTQRYADRLVLVQNELRPSEWERRGLPQPTVVVVWFEKKPGRGPRALRSTAVHGRWAHPMVSCLETLGLPAHVESDPQRLVLDLALKNLFVIVTNICGLRVGGDVGTLLNQHEALLTRVTDEVLAVETAEMGQALPESLLRIEMQNTMLADPRHECAGRAAALRLSRALAAARRLGVSTPTLEQIACHLEAS